MVAIIAIVVAASTPTTIVTCVVNIAILSPPLKLEQLTSPRPFITVVTVLENSRRRCDFGVTGRRVNSAPGSGTATRRLADESLCGEDN